MNEPCCRRRKRAGSAGQRAARRCTNQSRRGAGRPSVRLPFLGACARPDWINLDLGVSTYQLLTAHDLANGYYDPRRYESYEAVAYPYLKFSENVGLAMSVQAGAQREHSWSFRPGSSAAAELSMG